MLGLIIFKADWCPNCKLMDRANVVSAFRKLRPDIAVTIEDLSDGETELSKSLRVRTIPCLVLMDEAGEVIKRASGAKTASELERWVKAAE